MVIDAHTHLFGNAKESGDALLRSMELSGIDMAIVSCLDSYFPDKDEIDTLNKKTYDFAKAHKDKIMGACYVNPLNDNCTDVIRRGVEDMDMRMIKLWMACLCDDEHVDAVAREAIKYNVPILIHTFFMHSGNPVHESTGEHVRNLALRFPEAKLIMAHFGGNPYHGIRAVADCENVYTDYAGTFFGYDDVNYTLKLMGADRVVFGTDFPIANQAFGIGKIESAHLCNADKEKIYSGNISRLLGISAGTGCIDFGAKFEREHIDVNAMFGHMPYFKSPYPSLAELEKNRTDSSALIVSSFDSMFFQDPYDADTEFINTPCSEKIKKAVTVNPTMPNALRDLHKFSKENIWGVKIAPYIQSYPLSDGRVIRFAKECAKLSLPLLIENRIFDERQQYCVKSPKVSLEETENFLSAVPDTTVIMLTLRPDEVEKLAAQKRNSVFFDTSGFKGNALAFEKLVHTIGADKLMYGSLSPVYNEKSALYCISGADIYEEQKADILINNAKRIFKL